MAAHKETPKEARASAYNKGYLVGMVHAYTMMCEGKSPANATALHSLLWGSLKGNFLGGINEEDILVFDLDILRVFFPEL